VEGASKILKYAWIIVGVFSILRALSLIGDYVYDYDRTYIYTKLPGFVLYTGISVLFLLWLLVRLAKSRLKGKNLG